MGVLHDFFFTSTFQSNVDRKTWRGKNKSYLSLLGAFGTATEIGSAGLEKRKRKEYLVTAPACENAASYLTENVGAALIGCWRQETD